ncbi:anti-repressor SinI family protein [Pseudalkalibacillus sp. Hm43]
MEKRVEKEKLDLEWVELMKAAKNNGLTKSEIRDFIRSFSFKTVQSKA